ncbi:MAG: inositol monophosphatase [Chloroflexi bacterium]|nr:inositol monophosphatase [Chloroflexota bacterium]
MNLREVQTTAVTIAKEAGALLRDGFSQEKEIVEKSSALDWVTQFDQAAEELISRRLQSAFPDHTLVGEEGGAQNSGREYTWYIDPLDGTTNFAHNFPVFCVSMALYAGVKPLVGVIYDPMRDECFTAVTNQGAFLITNNTTHPLRITQTDTLIRSLVATGFPYDRHMSEQNNINEFGRFLRQVHGMRRAGSAALDMAYVAAGRLDGYWEFKLNNYDVAAGILLVQEAGGTVTDMHGRPALIAPQVALVASNGVIHSQMLAVLHTPH